MATRGNGGPEPSRIIKSISKLAGALVGVAVVTGKRIVNPPAQAAEEPSAKPEKKSVRPPAKKKTAVKTKTKGRKVKKKVAKKKVAKKKSTGPRRKSKASVKGPA